MAHDKHEQVDAVTGVATTGHSWDDIQELNNPLPRWWLWTFYAVHRLGHRLLHRLSGLAAGLVLHQGRCSAGSPATRSCADLEALKQQRSGMTAQARRKLPGRDPAEPGDVRLRARSGQGRLRRQLRSLPRSRRRRRQGLSEPERRRLALGRLADADRADDPPRRPLDERSGPRGSMPAFGRDGMLKREEISHAADYVRSLSGLPTDKGADLAAGAKVYADNCAACHGDKGQGNQELGAPNLSDKIWLFGSDKANIVEGLMNGRGGVMPAWHGRLDDTTIKALTLYVHSLGGDQSPESLHAKRISGRRATSGRCLIWIKAELGVADRIPSSFRSRRLRQIRWLTPPFPSAWSLGRRRAALCSPQADLSPGRQGPLSHDQMGRARRHARHLLLPAFHPLGSRPQRTGPGHSGRFGQQPLLFLLHRDLAAGSLLHHRPAGSGGSDPVPHERRRRPRSGAAISARRRSGPTCSMPWSAGRGRPARADAPRQGKADPPRVRAEGCSSISSGS